MPKNTVITKGPHRILLGDARRRESWRKLLGRRKVNLFFTSPPYADRRRRFYGGVLPKEYVRWFSAVAENIRDWCASGGSFFLNIKEGVYKGCRSLHVAKLVVFLVEEIGFVLIDELIWKKPAIPGRFPNRFKDAYERIFHFALSPDVKFRPDRVRLPSGRAFCYNDVSKAGRAGCGTLIKGKFKTGLALPSNVVEFNTNGQSVAHPAVFPAALAEFFIKTYSDEGDIVCDPFSGSGTTLIAAEKLSRRCCAVEIKKEYVELSLKRLQMSRSHKRI